MMLVPVPRMIVLVPFPLAVCVSLTVSVVAKIEFAVLDSVNVPVPQVLVPTPILNVVTLALKLLSPDTSRKALLNHAPFAPVPSTPRVTVAPVSDMLPAPVTVRRELEAAPAD